MATAKASSTLVAGISLLLAMAAASAQEAASAPAGQPAQEGAPASQAASAASTEAASDAEPARKLNAALLAVKLLPVTVAPDAQIDQALREECQFETALQHDVAKMLHHYHLGGGLTEVKQGRTLQLVIQGAKGDFGGAWSGQKEMAIHATLFVDGTAEREVDLLRYNNGANPFRGTCHVFRQHTRRLGKDVAAWIKDERYKPSQQFDDTKDDTKGED